MKRIFTLFILLLFWFNGSSQPEHSFFVIHCDPGFAHLFPKLRQMVDSASAHNVPLTIEMSPQWVDAILADEQKLQQVRQWQALGHEIGGHHHSIFHCFWDSLTNYTADSIALYQPAGPFCDSGTLRSNMQPFWDSLDSLCGDSLMLTWGSSDNNPAIDMYPGVPYRTDGGRTDPAQGFSNPYIVTHGPTLLDAQVYGPYTTCQIDYFFIDNLSKVNAVKNLYLDTGFSNDYAVVGVVTHVFDFNGNPAYFYNWLNFIEGKGCKTVRQILRQSGCTVSAAREEEATAQGLHIYPNPARSRIFISFGKQGRWHLKLVHPSGQVFWQQSIVGSQAEISLADLPAGMWLVAVREETGGATHTEKLIVLKP